MRTSRIRTQRVEGTNRHVVIGYRDGQTVILSSGKGTDLATAQRHASAYAEHYSI